jgi:hypothetical protein
MRISSVKVHFQVPVALVGSLSLWVVPCLLEHCLGLRPHRLLLTRHRAVAAQCRHTAEIPLVEFDGSIIWRIMNGQWLLPSTAKANRSSGLMMLVIASGIDTPFFSICKWLARRTASQRLNRSLFDRKEFSSNVFQKQTIPQLLLAPAVSVVRHHSTHEPGRLLHLRLI